MKITQPLILLSQLAVNQGTSLNDHRNTIQSPAPHRAFSETSSNRPQCDFSFASLLKHPQCDAPPNAHILGLKRDDFIAHPGANDKQLKALLNLNDKELVMHLDIREDNLGKPYTASNWDRLKSNWDNLTSYWNNQKFRTKFVCGMAIGLWGLRMMRRAQAAPLAQAAPPPGPAAQAAAGG